MEGRTILKRIFIIIGALIILGYSYFVISDFVRGPGIVIDSPISGYPTTTPAIVITGRTIHSNNLYINGSQTPVDLKGNFRSQLILAPGYNIIRVTAKDNYKREVEKVIEINLLEDETSNIEYPTEFDTTTPATSTDALTL